MARYIDVDKFLQDEIKRCGCVPLVGSCTTDNESLAYQLAKASTVDVVEVKHGEWIPVTYTYFGLKRYECSECKDDEYWQKRYLEHKEKYCPNCGAKMDGGKEE